MSCGAFDSSLVIVVYNSSCTCVLVVLAVSSILSTLATHDSESSAQLRIRDFRHHAHFSDETREFWHV